MRVVVSELRRGLVPRLAPVLAVVLVVLMRTDVTWWRGVWPTASAAVGSPLLFLGPALGALSAWEMSHRRDAFPEARVRSTAAALAAHVLAGLGMLFVGLAYATIVNLQAGAWGHPWGSYLLVAAAVVAGCVAVGFILAAVPAPVWFAPVITALACFLRLAWTQGGTDALPRVFINAPAYLELNPLAVAGALGEASVLVALALTTPAAVSRLAQVRAGSAYRLGGRRRAGVLAGCLVGALVLGAVVTGPPIQQERTATSDGVCTGRQIRLCVWPEETERLTSLTTMSDRAADVGERWGATGAVTLREMGLPETKDGNFIMGGEANWFLASSIADALTNQLVPAACYPAVTDTSQAAADFYRSLNELTDFLQVQIMGGTIPSDTGDSTGVSWAAVSRAATADTTTQQAWVRQRLARLVTGKGQCR